MMTLSRKYELTDETRIIDGRILHRIRALRDIPRYNVKKGDLGGFVGSGFNLFHEWDCWIADDACVYERAIVSMNALICENAVVSEGSRVCRFARVSGNARICGYCYIGGGANISGNAHISSGIEDIFPIDGDAEIADKRHVFYMGPVGRENWHFLAYRTKGGGACIKRSRFGFMPDTPVEIMDESHDDWQQCNDKYQILLDIPRELVGNNHEIKRYDEIPFMVQMALARSFEWDCCDSAGKNKPWWMGAEKKLPANGIRKYKLSNETRIVGGRILYRIRALRDIPRYCVKAGDVGGFVESEANLLHEGDCWIGGEARVYEGACVMDDALVSGWAAVSGFARVCEAAEVAGHVRIDKEALVCGKTRTSAASLGRDADISNERHIFLVGPVGPYEGPLGLDNYYLVAYRTKGGNICIRKSSSSFFHQQGERHPVRFCEDYSFLHEMARTQPDNWLDIEYGFMMQMMKSRIEEWKRDT